jgi:Spy/CpxP family protein refolding chaperone
MRPRHQLTIAICGLLLLAAALPALAQPPGHGHRGHGPGGMDGHRLEHLALRLELSDGQREELEASFKSRFEAGAEARRALFEARRALADQVRAEIFDEAAIREAAGVLAALEADAAVTRAKHAQQLRQILTPEQLAELKEMRDERGEGRFGRRGRRGRGFGGPAPTD